jgi:hypothetical protein
MLNVIEGYYVSGAVKYERTNRKCIFHLRSHPMPPVQIIHKRSKLDP